MKEENNCFNFLKKSNVDHAKDFFGKMTQDDFEPFEITIEAAIEKRSLNDRVEDLEKRLAKIEGAKSSFIYIPSQLEVQKYS